MDKRAELFVRRLAREYANWPHDASANMAIIAIYAYALDRKIKPAVSNEMARLFNQIIYD